MASYALESHSGFSLDGCSLVGTAAGIVEVGCRLGTVAGSGAGGGDGTSGATDSSFILVVDWARGSDDDPRDDGDLASVGSSVATEGAVTDMVGSRGVDRGVSSIGVATGVALAAAARAAAATRGFFEFLSRS